ncbi:hypothetical protein I350_05883 [Cryptococcus amylolentus CBS 6273]|uniref:CSC1/OSCA1-like 7TM region domain-containing protein n=1 Tax=Cryptococcus amylolentus CBS 6273 TaxID=1296118 RepID=A0A1E3JQ92_9TREE|nr:hypothetical protein I350_05883 [Cryptococcus amylolentus CBS 6273]
MAATTVTHPPPPSLHTHNRRHYYLCGGQTLSWEEQWYTEPFFTSYRASYDSAASTGPVQPPESVYKSVGECSRVLSSLSAEGITGSSALSASGSQMEGPQTTRVTTSIRSTFTSDGEVETTTYRSVITSTLSVETGSSDSSSMASSTSTAVATSTTTVSTATIPPATPSEQVAGTLNTCAGEWDWQGWGAVAGLGSGVIVGGLLWLAWIFLRSRVPTIFSPKSWYSRPDLRPSARWSFFAFLLPFLHLPSIDKAGASPSEGDNALHVLLAGLKLSANASVVALAVILPIIMAGVPCLRDTSPSNSLGGRLGALTDMSLVRLLDALDPSPDSPAADTFLAMLVSTGKKRNLPSTIAPAISSARTRLIVILVLLTVLSVGGGLFVVTRAYAALMRPKRVFEDETCHGVDMVWIDVQRAHGWAGLSEEGLRRWFKEWWQISFRDNRDQESEVEVLGLFAIPDTTELKKVVADREQVLLKLEQVETRYIHFFKVSAPSTPGGRGLETVWSPKSSQSTRVADQMSPSNQGADFLGPKGFYKVGSIDDPPSGERLESDPPTTVTTAPTGTKFHELNRDSILMGGRFQVGQRIKVDEHGNYVPDPSPPTSSESAGHLYSTGLNETDDMLGSAESGDLGKIPTRSASGHFAPMTTPADIGSISPNDADISNSYSDPALLRPQPRSHEELFPRPVSSGPQASSHRHSGAPSTTAKTYMEVRELRSKFKELNTEVERLQAGKFAEISQSTKGQEGQVSSAILGWIVVGRGVKWLHGADAIEGKSKEDILWDQLGQTGRKSEMTFWAEVCLLGFLLMAICVPCLGLAVGTAPGLSYYLGLFKPLARSDGFGSGFVEGLVPAIILSLAMGTSIWFVEKLAERVHSVTHLRRKLLAYKATFWLLATLQLWVMLLWVILTIALEYATQNFVLGVQKARGVGDGASWSSWFIFVLLLNIAFIAPGLYLLQGKRLLSYRLSMGKAVTPRKLFRLRQPPSYILSYAMAPCLLAVFYASTLLFLFPLLAIPILLTLYLTFIANRYMVSHVFIDSSNGHLGTLAGLWTVRRLGWVLALGPVLYGLIMLSRNEWALAAVSLAVGVIAFVSAETLTFWRIPSPSYNNLKPDTRQALDRVKAFQRGSTTDSHMTRVPSRQSELSLFRRVAALLPGYTRLPPDCPVPLKTDKIDDMFQTELAAYSNPDLRPGTIVSSGLYQETTETKGLVYPPEMLQPVPLIWLPYDEARVAENEAEDLAVHHGLVAIVDHVGRERDLDARIHGREDRRVSGDGGDVDSPLLDQEGDRRV